MRVFGSPASLSSLAEKKKVSGKLRPSVLEPKFPCTLYSTALAASAGMLFMLASRMASSFE